MLSRQWYIHHYSARPTQRIGSCATYREIIDIRLDDFDVSPKAGLPNSSRNVIVTVMAPQRYMPIYLS